MIPYGPYGSNIKRQIQTHFDVNANTRCLPLHIVCTYY